MTGGCTCDMGWRGRRAEVGGRGECKISFAKLDTKSEII